MDVNLHTMMLQNVPSIELNRRLLQNEINSRRVAQILDEASQPDVDLLPVRNRTRRTTSRPEPDPYGAMSEPVIRWSESADAVTTARRSDSDEVTRTAAAHANGSVVDLNPSPRKRPRTTRVDRVMPTRSVANGSVTGDDLSASIRTASVSPASRNASRSAANRTGVDDEWNTTSTTSATDGSTAQSIYCPAIPPDLRELSLCSAFRMI